MINNVNTAEITIKPTISFTEYKTVCDQVVNACFSNGKYSPEFLDIMERYYTIIAYTNCDFGIENITTDNIDELYDTLNNTEMTKIYCDITYKTQYQSLKNAINEAIDYRKNINYKTSAYSETDLALSSFVFKLEELVGKIGENISEENISKAMKFLTAFGENKENLSASNIINTLISKKVIGKEYKETKKSNKTISKTK